MDKGDDSGLGGAGGVAATKGVSSSSESTTTSSSASSGAGGAGGGGTACAPKQHLCGGVCTDVPETGCFADPTCTPCATPANGAAACSADGHCDVQCNAGYQKSGDKCQCASQCCADSDCPNGGTCNNGTCQAGTTTPSCDAITCGAWCLLQGKGGACQGVNCVCQ